MIIQNALRTAVATAIGLAAAISSENATRSRAGKWCGEVLAVGSAQRSETVLSGTLTRAVNWGPPGFGAMPESDAKFLAWILVLDFEVPTRVEGTDSSITAIQLRGSFERSGTPDQVLNRHVLARGTLDGWAAPSDVTPIIMQTEEVRPIGEVRCDGVPLAPKL